ncbi:hypothetical protein SPSYN_00925 [Sporotomaculum syntrophicum]|uniref:Uncharacterized protein n=1 Tax=Sporotomaculum syntrophicum TaxID=182264 RepID=A0A9D2WRM9_9FIRM|nr:hypothetical protein [Sporotomaculum syntrophicum]KAF1086184.1 hypothetical protein SPSYN_00925 [Sporotomaculum syntrophicum]
MLVNLNCPVELLEYQLYKTKSSEKVYCSLIINNVSNKVVKGLKAEIYCFDQFGDPINKAENSFKCKIEYKNGLYPKQNRNSDKKILLSDFPNTRKIEVDITKVLFDDNTVWDKGTSQIEKVELTGIEDKRILAYVNHIIGNDAKYFAKEEKNRWICVCGRLNEEYVTKCKRCEREKDYVLTNFSNENKICSDFKLYEETRLEELQKQAIEKKKKTIKFARITGSLCVLFLVAGFLVINVIIPEVAYKKALSLADAGKYKESITALEKLGDYKDSKLKINEITYKKVLVLADEGKYKEAITTLKELGDSKYSNSKIGEIAKKAYSQGNLVLACYAWKAIGEYNQISKYGGLIKAGFWHTVGLKSDGTVMAVGDNIYGKLNVSDWQDIVAIAAGSGHTVGLKSDNTVIAVGYNEIGECNVANWVDIVAVMAGSRHTVGLKSDGTVVAVGSNDLGQCNVSDWQDIVAIAAGGIHTVGLKTDGTVIAVGYNKYGQCNVSDWQDIVAIAAGYLHTVGLKSDGTVVIVGDNEYGQCNVSDWQNIMAVEAGSGSFHTVGLKNDGTVIAVGYNEFGQCNVSDWQDIVAIAAGGLHTVGLRNDGTVIAVGDHDYGQKNVLDWRIF